MNLSGAPKCLHRGATHREGERESKVATSKLSAISSGVEL